MTWDEFNSANNTVVDAYGGIHEKTDIECPKCGRPLHLNTAVLLPTCQPKYSYWCDCGRRCYYVDRALVVIERFIGFCILRQMRRAYTAQNVKGHLVRLLSFLRKEGIK